MTRVVITTVRAVSAPLEKEILKKVSAKWADSSFEFVVDPTLIGGIKITVGAREIDASVRRQLQDITQKLLSA